MDSRDLQLSPEMARALYRALKEDAEAPARPEELLSLYTLPIHIELMTDKGSYSVDDISPRCEKTLALLEQYGVTIVEPEIDGPYFGD